MCSTICAMAQQQGIVRTLERPGKSSEALAGVTINVLEYPNAIVSKKDGKFSFSISGKRQGDSFTISRVQKKGYTLVDKQLKGRSYAYSSSVKTTRSASRTKPTRKRNTTTTRNSPFWRNN